MTQRPEFLGLVYDVDGTIADHFTPPPRELRGWIADLDEAGVVQVLASGKYHEYLGGMARGLGLTITGWVIGENGGTIFDWTALHLEVLGAHVPEVEALRHELWAEHLAPDKFYEEPNEAGVTIFPRGRDYGEAEALLALMQRIVREHGWGLAPEIHPDAAVVAVQSEVGKGTALRAIAERVGVPAERFVAFGEGVNDLSMMEIAYPVAPADAHPRVVEVVQRRGGYVASQPGPAGVLEGFAHLRCEGLVGF
jgi:HAD superfamily hydrolase (TIGR01484 family)